MVAVQTVLFADQSQTMRALARLYLTDLPYELVTADNGRRALELARSTHPSVVIADVLLPEIDGYELCRTLRESDPNVTVFLTHAEYVPVERGLAETVGAADVLRKPLEQAVLLAALAESKGAGAPPTPPTPSSQAPSPASSLDMEEALNAALPGLVAEMLPSLLDERLERLVEEVVGRAAADPESALGARVHATVEKVVWKTVPSLAEELIKEAIERLTAEADDS